MKLIALCGAAGAGKDTVADMLPARKLAFADALYQEVAEAFNVTTEWLKRREHKESITPALATMNCEDECFEDFLAVANGGRFCITDARSPRQILQWWGDYRRSGDSDYFTELTKTAFWYCDGALSGEYVLSDCRFANEAAMVRELGGQIWQVVRPGVQAGGTGHASDVDGSAFAPDKVIINDGDLTDLRDRVLAAWEAKS